MAYDNNMTFVLFPNKDKVAGDSKPDLSGSAEVDGVRYWASAWKNKSKDGTKSYLKGKLQKVEGKPTTLQTIDDEIAF